MSELISNQLEEYIHRYTSEVSEVLDDLERNTYKDVLMPNMISGKVQGKFLALLSKMMRPSRILEIGTFTGYSAICLAEGLVEEGKLITIDIEEERADMVQQAIISAGYQYKILPMIGNALEIIPTLDHSFDLVFIDADKINYSRYFDLVIDKVRPGGVILADNVLWKGKVVSEKSDKNTDAIRAFNEKIYQDERVENVILSVRDGITLIYKK
ncbi:MAG TPA: O-methyltransferase [Chitinophagales bacterium]|nr:O-methyltransferase [Chitinophagales bacterium]